MASVTSPPPNLDIFYPDTPSTSIFLVHILGEKIFFRDFSLLRLPISRNCYIGRKRLLVILWFYACKNVTLLKRTSISASKPQDIKRKTEIDSGIVCPSQVHLSPNRLKFKFSRNIRLLISKINTYYPPNWFFFLLYDRHLVKEWGRRRVKTKICILIVVSFRECHIMLVQYSSFASSCGDPIPEPGARSYLKKKTPQSNILYEK